jgi:hypothetical protein
VSHNVFLTSLSLLSCILSVRLFFCFEMSSILRFMQSSVFRSGMWSGLQPVTIHDLDSWWCLGSKEEMVVVILIWTYRFSVWSRTRWILFFHLDLVMTAFVLKNMALMTDDDSAGCVLLKVCQLLEFWSSFLNLKWYPYISSTNTPVIFPCFPLYMHYISYWIFFSLPVNRLHMC